MDALLDVAVFATQNPVAVGTLTAGERLQFREMRGRARRREWLTGRRALRAVLGDAGLDTDTSTLTWPDRRVSVSYSGELAVAASAVRDDVVGVGVDVETQSALRPETARFFLTGDELAVVGSDDAILLRLWTIKEALFKANPHNAGTTLLDYRLVDPLAPAGAAHGPQRCPRLHYMTTTAGSSIVSVAIAMEDAPC